MPAVLLERGQQSSRRRADSVRNRSTVTVPLALKGSPAILAGRIFDDRGNRIPRRTRTSAACATGTMFPMRSCRNEPMRPAACPACRHQRSKASWIGALRERFAPDNRGNQSAVLSDRDLIERWLDRAVIKPQAAEIHVVAHNDNPKGTVPSNGKSDDLPPTITIALPRSAGAFADVKGILHPPSQRPTVSPETCEAVLRAIAKARMLIEELVTGRASSFAEIAEREGRVERHIRLLAPLASVSPQIISALIDQIAPPDFTVTNLARGLAYLWSDQGKKENQLSFTTQRAILLQRAGLSDSVNLGSNPSPPAT